MIREKIEEVLEEKPIYDFNKKEDLDKFMKEGKSELEEKLGLVEDIKRARSNYSTWREFEKKFESLLYSNFLEKGIRQDVLDKLVLGEIESQTGFINNGLNLVSRLFSEKSIKDIVNKVRIGYSPTKGRALYYGKSSKYGEAFIKVHKADKADAVIHEFGHHFEAESSARDVIKNFYKNRTLGEKERPASWGGNEVVKRDKFFTEYTGRVYIDGYTETFSTAIQAMSGSRRALDFYVKDPEHFSLVFRLLRGDHIL